ncbi:MAG TPA: hypothetical protein PK504_12960 [Ferruginibacter sp.]|nr:hypothetical protein [Ferruginibacter sp.]HRE64667.1 hypothetical protein [Ferruginibacter sp.]
MNNNQKPLPSLILCIVLDLVGYASFSVPLLGEFADIVWAPVSGLLFYKLFGGKMGLLGGGFSFLEEFLPFTDFIPTFTIAWALRYFGKEKHQVSIIKSMH